MCGELLVAGGPDARCLVLIALAAARVAARMAVATVVVMVAVMTVTVGMAAKKKKKAMPFCARQTSTGHTRLDRDAAMQRTAIGFRNEKVPTISAQKT